MNVDYKFDDHIRNHRRAVIIKTEKIWGYQCEYKNFTKQNLKNLILFNYKKMGNWSFVSLYTASQVRNVLHKYCNIKYCNIMK